MLDSNWSSCIRIPDVCYLFQQPMLLQVWLLYTDLIQFSVQLQFSVSLWVILHDQLLIVVSKINLSPVQFPHEDDLKTNMTWRWRWLKDSEDLRCRWWDELVDTKKKTSAKNCVERIPSKLRGSVDVFATSECIHLCILCIVTQCLSMMYL